MSQRPFTPPPSPPHLALTLPWIEKDDIFSVTFEDRELAISHAGYEEYIACVQIGPWCCSGTWMSPHEAKIAVVDFVRHYSRSLRRT